jgi:hypothetical protein
MDNKLQTFSFNTKKICLCTFTSIFIIILFVLSPLNSYFKTSLFMKFMAAIIILYSIHLSILQINVLKNNTDFDSSELNSQLNMNLYCNYIFTLFLCMLFYFLIKSFIYT